jgi:hypothetical protein
MEPEGSSTSLQESATCPYSEAEQSSPCTPLRPQNPLNPLQYTVPMGWYDMCNRHTKNRCAFTSVAKRSQLHGHSRLFDCLTQQMKALLSLKRQSRPGANISEHANLQSLCCNNPTLKRGFHVQSYRMDTQ